MLLAYIGVRPPLARYIYYLHESLQQSEDMGMLSPFHG